MKENIPSIRNMTRAFIAIYALALFVPVMNVDAAQYAELSRELLRSSDWTKFYIRGVEYLDKPPLHFWLCAISYKIFGVHYWSYKLPSYLFFILASLSIRKIGTKLYDQRVGDLASFFFVSSFCGMLMVNDVRTDTILIGTFSFSIWQLLEFQENSKWKNLVGAFAGIGASMLVKGPMGLVFPGAVFFAHHVYRREWKKLFRWQWIVGILIVAVMLLPMCLGLYHQFDLHPEKVVNENTGVSGLRFYFWTQTFGRVTGESDWGTKYTNGSTPFFFTHTFLWSFAPWFLLTIGGIIHQCAQLFRKELRHNRKELITLGGFVLTFIIISISKYRLPHYVYITFPFAALLSAVFYYEFLSGREKLLRIYSVFNFALIPLLASVVFMILFLFFPSGNIIIRIFFFTWSLLTMIFYFRYTGRFERTFYPLMYFLQVFYIVLLLHFYPSLLEYDASTKLGKILARQQDRNIPVYVSNSVYDNSFDFNARLEAPASSIELDTIDRMNGKKPFYVYTDADGKRKADSLGFSYQDVWEADNYPVQFLTFPFLFEKTRPEKVKKRYLLHFTSAEQR